MEGTLLMGISFSNNNQGGANYAQANAPIATNTSPGLYKRKRNLGGTDGPARNNNTWYSNSTGRPMMVCIGMYTSKNISVRSANSGNGAYLMATGGDPSEASNCFIVKHGDDYKTTGYRTWSEFESN